MSGQRVWQVKMLSEGRCRQCGRVRDNDTQLCKVCREKDRLRAERHYREYMGNRVSDTDGGELRDGA